MNNIIDHSGVNTKVVIPYKNINDYLDFVYFDSEFINHILESIKNKISNA